MFVSMCVNWFSFCSNTVFFKITVCVNVCNFYMLRKFYVAYRSDCNFGGKTVNLEEVAMIDYF